MNAIEMRNVSVVRNGIKILDDVNLMVKENENVAIIGPNGSGKTTLMKLLRGDILPYFDEPGRTTFKMFGSEKWNLFELRNRIGMVSMDLQSRFDDNMRIKDVIMSGFFSSMDVYRNHCVTEEMIEKTEKIGKIMDLSDKMDRDIGTVSLGEMRRALISRALISDPEMLVLDEPMTGLDMIMRSRFRRMFDFLIDRGVNIIMITHELEDISKNISRIIMIKDGKIFADGKKEDMLTSELISELYGIPITVECCEGSYHMYEART